MSTFGIIYLSSLAFNLAYFGYILQDFKDGEEGWSLLAAMTGPIYTVVSLGIIFRWILDAA